MFIFTFILHYEMKNSVRPCALPCFMVPQWQPQMSVLQFEKNPILYRTCDRIKNAAIIGNETILKSNLIWIFNARQGSQYT